MFAHTYIQRHVDFRPSYDTTRIYTHSSCTGMQQHSQGASLVSGTHEREGLLLVIMSLHCHPMLSVAKVRNFSKQCHFSLHIRVSRPWLAIMFDFMNFFSSVFLCRVKQVGLHVRKTQRSWFSMPKKRHKIF